MKRLGGRPITGGSLVVSIVAAVFGAAVLAGAAWLVAATEAGAQDPEAIIAGTVSQDGQPVAGISVDLFTADADGNRLEWLETTVTGTEGGFGFNAAAGCYAITAIAPDQRVFTNGTPWATTAPICLTVGESRSGVDADLAVGDRALITGAVAFGAGPIDGIQVDLFQANADGSRGAYLQTTQTGERGNRGQFEFEAPAGCYVLTLIAGDGNRWTDSLSQWLNLGGCVAEGQNTNLGTAQIIIVDGGPSKIVEVSVTASGVHVPGVVVDIFDANADGSRGTFLDSFTTRNGPISYGLGAITGCRVLTFVAPSNRTFVASGTRWLNQPFCVLPDQDVYRFDVELTPVGVTCAAGAEFESIFRDDFDGSELGNDWSVYNGSGNAGFGLRRPSAVTVADGRLIITADMQNDSLVSGGIALGLSQAYGKYVFRVRTDDDPTQAMSGEVLTWPTSGIHPRDGENNIYSTLVQTPSRTPFYSFIHKPFGSASDQVYFEHNADGAQFQTMTMEWTPNRISITRQGPGGNQDSETFVLQETAEDLIPDVAHHPAIQLDAWKHSVAGPIRLEVDWVEVHRYCG